MRGSARILRAAAGILPGAERRWSREDEFSVWFVSHAPGGTPAATRGTRALPPYKQPPVSHPLRVFRGFKNSKLSRYGHIHLQAAGGAELEFYGFHGARVKWHAVGVNHLLAAENKTPTGWRRWWPVLAILVAALSYYGSYWRYWFNTHDEGGTACLVAQRLLAGERPWVDVELGYNLGWFMPLVALFKVTGVNYLAARAWFLTLATLTALLGYNIVSRVSGRRWLGLSVGLLLVVLPGSQFKNYIPLAEAANTACIFAVLAVLPAVSRRWLLTVGLAGVVLGLTFLVRVELGIFFTVIWLGLLGLLLLDSRLVKIQRLRVSALSALLLVAGFLLPQTPAYLALKSRGLETHLVNEYTKWFSFLGGSVVANKPAPAAKLAPVEEGPATAPVSPEAAVTKAAPAEPEEKEDRALLARKPLRGVLTGTYWERQLPFLTYAPLVGFAVFLFLGLGGGVCILIAGKFTIAARSMQWLLLIGGSLTTFPQFFLFRPDPPHLSEFMPGYLIAMAGSAALLFPATQKRIATGAIAAFLLLQTGIFACFALQHPSRGTIAARQGRKTWFVAENGVNIRTSKKEAAQLSTVRDAVLAHSKPGEFLICFPYNPGYNLMTNRPTYLRNVYVDNQTHSRSWATETLRDFEQKQPAVVIVDDRAINGSEGSRFSQWAAPVHAFLRMHYKLVTQFGDVEVFALHATPIAPTP